MKATISGTTTAWALALLSASFLSNNSALGFSTLAAPATKSSKFNVLKPAFPANVDPVKAGGWYNIERAAATDNPKDELVKLIIDGLRGGDTKDQIETKSSSKAEDVEALVTVLYAMGKGFDASYAQGNWSPVYSKQGTKSPKFQKVVAKKETAGKSQETFDTTSMTFSGTANILKKGLLGSKVKYNPVGEGYSKSTDGKIVLRRIQCDIVGASWKFWFFPRIPLPLRVKGGYLDYLYLDNDIRITRGNRGGLFVHFRPEYLEARI